MRRSPARGIRFGAATLVATALATGLIACSGSGNPNQFPDENAGEYEVEVTSARFPLKQTVAETYDMVLAVRNTGDEAVPDINVSIELPDRDSTLAFAYRTTEEDVASPQRPVWVIEEGFPKLAGTVGRGGAETASRRTFQFGTLAPEETAKMIWRVTAIQPGFQEVAWIVDAGLSPEVQAIDRSGATPEGFFEVEIGNRPVLTRVNRKGKVVPVSPDVQREVETEEEDSE